jgi:mannitol-1-/sugar-/sorbitol-6-phosphatase
MQRRLQQGGVVSRFDCETILFDLDGVLVDSISSVERATRIWAERHGLDTAQVIKSGHGRRTEEIVRDVAPHLDPDAEARELNRIEIEDVANVRRVEGASDLLAGLPTDSWAVVTSGTRALATARMRHTGLPMPRVLVSAEDVENGKPDPECYLKAAKLIGVAPQRCVVVEDALPGILAARAAHMSVIAVATTHSASELSDADAVAHTLFSIRVEVAGAAARNDKHGLSLLVVED